MAPKVFFLLMCKCWLPLVKTENKQSKKEGAPLEPRAFSSYVDAIIPLMKTKSRQHKQHIKGRVPSLAPRASSSNVPMLISPW